jgi:hypothetical protein
LDSKGELMKLKTILFSLLLSASAAADTRLTVPLVWEHLAREEGLEVFMSAPVLGGNVFFQRWIDGRQVVSIELATGETCATSGSKMVAVTLRCGTKVGYYWLTKKPKGNIQLEWVSK